MQKPLFSRTSNLLFLVFISLSFLACEREEVQTVTTFTNLTFEDEFAGTGSIDAASWNVDMGIGNAISGDGWGNNELQYYTDRSENIKVEDGMLHITAMKESFMESNYTSARINSSGKLEQEYGRFEARIQLPWGQGLWPAFWILGNNIDEVGWPKCG